MPGRMKQLGKPVQDRRAAIIDPSFSGEDRDGIVARGSVWGTLIATWPLPTGTGTPWKSWPADSAFPLRSR